APGDGTFWYAGLVAEGSSLPVVPVDKVLAKLRAGEPVTICLIGDSVTENAKGFRGGSREADGLSAFDNGNPGAMKRYLEKEFGNEVSTISHREPPGWPDDGDIKALEAAGRVIELDRTAYRDGRVEYDASKKIRLVNMGKGGAASPDAWRRCPETFTEPNDWRKKGNSWNDTYDTKLPPVLRNGVAHYKPDLCIINFGTNDANGSHVGWTAAEYLFHMKVLVTMLQEDLGAAIIVSTPHRWTKGTHQNPHTQMEFADAIRAYAARSGVRLADIYNEYEFAEGDSIHPGNSGHKHIADAYMKALLGQKSEPKNTTRAAAAQFKDNGDGTVSDTKTGLVWPADTQAAGGEPMDLEAAKKVIEQWNAEKKFGRSAWRLPTEKELLGLTDPSRRPALPEGAPFKNLARVYLTDSVGMALKTGTYYWLVDMQYGMEFFPNKTDAPATLWPVCKGE
ncbi:MAG: DUF1566 domain-containing protein, partial [Planctomycetes bacterium]|nr:DUF1566 domain-containing protein [Planctomycetota bacterium]